MAQDNVLNRHENAESGGMHDEPRIVKSKEAARAGDRHREGLHAMVIGGVVIVGIVAVLAILYFLQVF